MVPRFRDSVRGELRGCGALELGAGGFSVLGRARNFQKRKGPMQGL